MLKRAPGCGGGKEAACQRRRHKRCVFNPWVGKIPWRRAWQPTSVFLPGESHGQRSLMTVHRVTRSRTRLKQLGMHPGKALMPVVYFPSLSQRADFYLLYPSDLFWHIMKNRQNPVFGISLAVQWVRPLVSTVWGTGSIPSQGTKIHMPHSMA